jgi:transposase
MRKRRTFTKAFKAEAVRLLERGDKPAAELARELGVPRNRLYKWQAQVRAHGEQSFPGSGRLPAPEDEATSRVRSTYLPS